MTSGCFSDRRGLRLATTRSNSPDQRKTRATQTRAHRPSPLVIKGPLAGWASGASSPSMASASGTRRIFGETPTSSLIAITYDWRRRSAREERSCHCVTGARSAFNSLAILSSRSAASRTMGRRQTRDTSTATRVSSSACRPRRPRCGSRTAAVIATTLR